MTTNMMVIITNQPTIMNISITRKRLIAIATALLIVGLAATFTWQKRPPSSSPKVLSRTENQWDLVSVSSAKDFSSIKVPAQVRSNRFAIIAPRRVGIVQDLLVDIGDEVSKGQTIGSMLPEGVEGQGSAAINEASARLQRAKAALANAEGVAVESVAVATKQWRETNLQVETQSTLDNEAQKQLEEKKREAVLVATQAWENTKIALFGPGKNYGARSVIGNFSNAIQETRVYNLAEQIQKMEETGQWGDPSSVIDHLVHLENFLSEAEVLYKNAQPGRGIDANQVTSNLSIIQTQQLTVSNIKQEILALEEKAKRFASVQAEREAGVERSREVVDLVQSQQDLSVTQAEKNVQVALANYNAALVRAGHQSITSPFDGVITARMVEVGQAVTPNTALFYLDGAQTARSSEAISEVHFSLPESWFGKVNSGDNIDLKTFDGASMSGKIFRLSQNIDAKHRAVFGTAIALEESNSEPRVGAIDAADKSGSETAVSLPHGQSLFVYLDDPNTQIFSVPTLAIKARRGRYFVWKWADGIPLQLNVELVAEDGERSQIYSRDLTLDDTIIGNPSVSLFNRTE